MLTKSIFKSDKRFAPVRRARWIPLFLPARAPLRLPLRALSTLLIAVGVATCSDTPPTGVKHSALGPNGRAAGRVAFAPVFSAAALGIAQHLSEFGIDYDRVRVVLVRPPSDTAKDTTVAFTPASPDLTLSLTVEVRSSDEVFDVEIQFLSGPNPVFKGEGRARSHTPDQEAPPRAQIAINYVGPGANVARISLSPKTATLPSDQPLVFVATAFDANNNPVSPGPLSWTTSDSSVATVSGAGSLQGQGKRGTVVVTATTPTGISDRATVAIVPTPASITLVGGGGQIGIVGTPLTTPGVIQVNAADGLGVPGVTVSFAPPGGGHIGSPAAITDANGRASTSLTLGTVAGPQVFAASVGELRAVLPETALPGGPSAIDVVSGNGQTDTVRRSLAPLVVRVADQFGNAISGIMASWARTNGGGSLGGTSSTTGDDGRATMTYTLGSTAGSESVTTSVSGVATHATFTFQAIAAAPSTIAVVSGNAQTARVGTALAAPLVVRVADDVGAPVSGATVSWTAANGNVISTSTTDANGQSSVILTLGSHTGSASATALIANGKRVTFIATAQPGIVAAAVFSTQPTNATAGGMMSTVRVALLDAFGNQTSAANPVSIALAGNLGNAALSGTLARGATNGVATFNDLKIDKAGVGYTLIASSGNTTNITSSAFSIAAPLVAAKLTIVEGDNQRAAAGSPLAIAPSVKVTDASGNAVSDASVTFSPSDAGDIVPTTAVVSDANGRATLTAWILGPHPGPQTLTVSSSGLTSVVLHAGAFGGPPTMLGIVTQPSSAAVSGVVLAFQPAVQLLDHFGNPTATSGLTITVTVSNGSLIGNTTATADPVTGLASFTNLAIVGSGPVTLTFSGQGVHPTTSSSIAVTSSTPPN
jgi:hypothetical protein